MEIDDSTFFGCTSLTYVTISANFKNDISAFLAILLQAS